MESDASESDLREEVAEAVSLDLGSERLREAHLHNGQVEARALFAPYFAVTAVAASLITAWAMYGSVELKLVVGWAALIAFANWVSCRRALEAAAWGSSRTARPRARWFAVAEAFGLAGLWSALPTYAFATQPPDVQVVIGGAMAAMIGTAVALAAIPAAAVAWIATLTGAFCLAYYFGGAALDPKIALTFVMVAGAGAFGLARLTRWIFGQLKVLARTRAQAESIRLLLNEYEHRGVGWLWQVDAENRVVYISSRMTALLGRSTNQMIGHSLPASLGGTSALGRILLSRQPFANLEMELKTRRGARWISLSGDPIIDMTGAFQGFRGVGQDVTDVRRTQERLTNLANMDVLSGLPNRGRVRQLLGEALSGSAGGGAPCAIMFLDLDGFKPVNDTFGHPKGDVVLKSVAQRLLKEAGPFGQVGRMGGDEFAIVIKDANSRRMVETLADRLIAAIAEPFHIDKAEVRIGVSIGCAFGPVDGQSVDDLIQKADLALYQAKAMGRGTCRFFNADMQNEAEDRLRLEQDMRTGIKANQFRLLFQPQIDAADQSLMGFEALIRWHHPTRGIVPPNHFIPLAEESGLIMELGEWVIQEACRAAAAWPEHIGVAINVSAKQLIYPALPNTINEAIRKYRLQPDRLELEVTESIFLGDSANAVDVLKRLRALGVGIALDDFGTGYSSLGYLNKAVFHKLKIDGSFVRESADNKETVAIIQSIVQLAKSFRMTVTAEGVETADDFTRMRDLGCHQIQGYLFGRPMNFEKASELIHGIQQRLSA
ncbi:MAG TPA: EAL domain-containing protein [Allosphingosinicella sp.]|nr:EAL domain-containing protein [Allosphingosinicella sp.]